MNKKLLFLAAVSCLGMLSPKSAGYNDFGTRRFYASSSNANTSIKNFSCESPDALIERGFDIGKDWYILGVDGQAMYSEDKRDCFDREKLQHHSEIVEAVLINGNNHSDFAYVYRIVAEPKQEGRNWGFLGINSYGDRWCLDNIKSSVKLEKGEITDFKPKNEPLSFNISMGVGTSEISCGVSYDVSELDVESKTSLYNDTYATNYTLSGVTKYSCNTQFYYGMFRFTSYSLFKIQSQHVLCYNGFDYHGTNDPFSIVTSTREFKR